MRKDTNTFDPDGTVMDDDFWASILKETMDEAESRMGESGQTAPEEGATAPEDDGATAPEELSPHAVSVVTGPLSIRRGEMLLDTYRVESDMIGKGGMGAVWKVRHMRWNTDLAMKRPKPSAFQTEKQKQDFIRECECWINLGLHPNIVSCYYVRELDGTPTIFSEWMENGDLETHIKNGTLYDGTDAEVRERLLDIAIQFARGLRYAHENNLVHRDVKPDNLLLTKDWEAKVSDFGISQARAALSSTGAGQSDGDPNATQAAPGGRAKTPSYCSPEQAEDQPLTRRTDIYSWAVSVLEMYLGRKPWAHGGQITGPVAGLLCRDYFEMCEEHPIPETLQELLAKCLEQEPDERPHDFGEVEAELLAIYRAETGKDYARPGMETAANTADGLNNQAVSYMEIGMEDSALRSLARADRIDASHPEAMYNRALVEWRKGARTDIQIYRQLQSHPYFTDTEAGCRALLALIREAGKDRMDAPLLEEGLNWHELIIKSSDAFLWQGRVYIVFKYWDKDKKCYGKHSLRVFDALSGRELGHDDFKTATADGERAFTQLALSADGTRAALMRLNDTLVLYELAGRRALREYSLSRIGARNFVSSLRLVGEGGRFLRRTINGPGSGSGIRELYDLRTGTQLADAKAYDDWELILAGVDGELGPPRGKAYAASLSDGRSAVPIFGDENGLRFCGEDGEPAAPVPTALSSFLRRGDLRVLRLTDDGRAWLQNREGVTEFDLASGKALRSFEMDRFHGCVFVEGDGQGVLVTVQKIGSDRLRWAYRRLDPIRPEDRAAYLYTAPENYARYTDRLRSISFAAKRFDRARSSRNKVAMCAAYDEAMALRGFYGSPSQRSMAELLNSMCRQTGGEIFLYRETEVRLKGEEREELLAPYGLGSVISDELDARIRKSISLLDDPIASPDGRRLLLLSQVREIDAPEGPGIYLMDVPTEKLCLLKPYPEKGFYNTAGFCSDRAHIVYGNSFEGLLRYADISDGSAQARDVGEWEPLLQRTANSNGSADLRGFMMRSWGPLPGPDGGFSILWPRGIYTFLSEADRKAFLDQAGERIQILDVCESHGLIAYIGEHFCVWSVDEERRLLDMPLPQSFLTNAACARFSRAEGDVVRLLAAWEGVGQKRVLGPQERYPVEIYQFRCAYTKEPTRRPFPPTQRSWPAITLPACGPDSILTREEHAMYTRAVELCKAGGVKGLTEAYGIFCELTRHAPARGENWPTITVNKLKMAFGEMRAEGDVEGLKKYADIFSARLDQYPNEKNTPELVECAKEALCLALLQDGTPESAQRAYEIGCELMRRFPNRECHRKNRDIAAANLEKFMSELREKGEADELERCARVFAERLEKHPDEEKSPELLLVAEDFLAFLLVGRGGAEDLRRAIALYEGLAERAPDRKSKDQFENNAAVVRRQLSRLEPDPKRNGLFAFFGRRK